jgi:hypothetical protein
VSRDRIVRIGIIWIAPGEVFLVLDRQANPEVPIPPEAAQFAEAAGWSYSAA